VIVFLLYSYSIVYTKNKFKKALFGEKMKSDILRIHNKKYMKEFWNNYKSKIIWTLLLILIVWGIVAIRKQGGEEVKNAQVKMGTIKETVKVTGSVRSQNDTSLSFEKSGTVAKIYVTEGQSIKAGTVLMSLSGGDSRAQVLEAEANLKAEEARLQNLKEGARTEEVDLKKITLSSAESDKKIATTNAFESARNALSSALDILGYKLRDTIKNSSGDEYSLTFSSCNASLEADVARNRKDLDSFVKKWESDLSVLEKNGGAKEALVLSLGGTERVRTLTSSLSDLASLSCATASSKTQQDISTAKTTLNATVSDINNKISLLSAAHNAVSRASADLTLTTSSPVSSRVASAEAAVSAAYARLLSAKNTQNKNSLIAPIAGVVSSVGIEEGELASVGKTVVRIIGTNSYKITAKLTENDVAKVSIGNKAEVTLPALSLEKPLGGVITSIDSAESDSGSTPLYTVKISLTDEQDLLKSGMSADVIIVTSEKKDVLVIPFSFVTQKEKDVYLVSVEKKEGDKTTLEEKEVILGKKGTDGLIEVVAGLAAGDLLRPHTPTSSKK